MPGAVAAAGLPRAGLPGPRGRSGALAGGGRAGDRLPQPEAGEAEGQQQPKRGAAPNRGSSPQLAEVPSGNAVPTTIYIRNGTNFEMLVLNGKHDVTLLGEDRKKTIVEYPDCTPLNPGGGPYRRGMILGYRSNDLTFANFTMRNTTATGVGGGQSQAEAIILNGTLNARAILTDLDLYSFQDTLQINGQAYISNCYIAGDVDYLWGLGPCFENCQFKSFNSNTYYTQIRNPAENHGFVFLHCVLDGADGVTGNLLSRIEPTRFPASEVVWLDCSMTSSA